MINEEEYFNYCTQENRAQIIECSSNLQNAPCSNILNINRKAIWLSGEGLPQSFVVDLSKLIQKPKQIKVIGFDWWHDYPTNPSKIEIQVAEQDLGFKTWSILSLEQREGMQVFDIDPLPNKYKLIKIIIKETFGAAKTYLNQLFLFDEYPIARVKRMNSHPGFVSDSDFKQERQDDKGMPQNRPNIPKPINNDLHPTSTNKKQKFQQQQQQQQIYEKEYQQQNNKDYFTLSDTKGFNQESFNLQDSNINDIQQQQNQSNKFINQHQQMLLNNNDVENNNSNSDLVKKLNQMDQFISSYAESTKFQNQLPIQHQQYQQPQVSSNQYLNEEYELPQDFPKLTSTEKDVRQMKQQIKQLQEQVQLIQENQINLEILANKLQDNVGAILGNINNITSDISSIKKMIADGELGQSKNNIYNSQKKTKPKDDQQRDKQHSENINEKNISTLIEQKMEAFERMLSNTVNQNLLHMEAKLNQKILENQYNQSINQMQQQDDKMLQQQQLPKQQQKTNQMHSQSNRDQIIEQQKQNLRDIETIHQQQRYTQQSQKHVAHQNYQLTSQKKEENIQQQNQNYAKKKPEASNPRVMQLLDKLQQKLQQRQQKLELLNSEKKKEIEQDSYEEQEGDQEDENIKQDDYQQENLSQHSSHNKNRISEDDNNSDY